MVNEDDVIELTLSGQDHDGLNADYLVLTSGPANGSQTTSATSNALEYRTTYTPTPEYTGQDTLLYTMTDVDGHAVTVEVPINFAKVNDETTNASNLQGNAYEGLVFTDTLTISDADGLPLTLTDPDCPGTASIVISDDVDHGTLAVEQSAIDDTHIQLILHYRSDVGSSQNDQFTLSYTDNQCFPHSETYSIQVTALPGMTTFGGSAQHVIKEEETVSKVLTYSDGDGLIQSIQLLGTCPTDYAAPTVSPSSANPTPRSTVSPTMRSATIRLELMRPMPMDTSPPITLLLNWTCSRPAPEKHGLVRPASQTRRGPGQPGRRLPR